MRLKNISALVSILFCIVGLRLWHLQIIKGGYYCRLSENNRIRLVPVPAVRGRILDRNGLVLAESRPSFEVGLIENELEDKQQEMDVLSKILNLSSADLQRRLLEDETPPFAPKIVARGLSRQQAIMVEAKNLELPGVLVQVFPLRYYPLGQVGSHVLGYLGMISREQLSMLKPYGYQPQDIVGRCGIEETFDQRLRGTSGGRQVEVDYRGQVIRVLNQRPPVRGQDLQLSIDIRLQRKAEELLGRQRGVIAVMNPDNGQMLVLASQPGYDPNIFVNPVSESERESLVRDKNKPLINRALSGLYPPGSIFKIIVAAGILERKKMTQYSTISCPGYYEIGQREFRCWRKHGHGSLNITQALAGSCNVFFYRSGLMLGPEDMARFARLFGLGRVTKLELNGEKKGLIPDRGWKKLTSNQPWYGGETANYAIGQGYITITPIQALMMVTTLANNGYLVRPTLIKESRSHLQEKIDISEGTLNIIKQGLFDAVQEEYGTGYHARLSGLEFSGKTGTAQIPGGRKNGWFVGYAPSQKPEISFVVMIEETEGGGREATKIAGEWIKFWNDIR